MKLVASAASAMVMWSTRHRPTVFAAWLVLLAGSIGVALLGVGQLGNDFGVPGSDSDRAVEMARHIDPHLSGTNAIVVLHTDTPISSGPSRAAAGDVVANIRDIEEVSAVSDPFARNRVSQDGTTALIDVLYRSPVEKLSHDDVDTLRAATSPAAALGMTVEFGGQLITENASRGSVWVELIGVAFALVVLTLTLGSGSAALVCISVAGIGVGTGLALVTVLSAATPIPTTALTLAAMVGLGVSVDYALLLVARLRDEAGRGSEADNDSSPVLTTSRTAGGSILVAGITVVVAMAGLLLAGIPAISAMAYACASTVATGVLAALTLLPAVMTVPRLAHVVDVGPGPHGERAHRTRSRWRAWCTRVTARPWWWLGAALVVVGICAAPIANLQLGQLDASVDPTSHTQRRAYDLIAEKFTAGANDPLLVVAATEGAAVEPGHVVKQLAADPDVARVDVIGADARGIVLSVAPHPSARSPETVVLIDRVRRMDVSGRPMHVGGASAAYVDFTKKIESRLPIVVLTTIGLSFLVLLCAFGAPVVAVKSALLNGLSIAASLGVVVAVFQFVVGWPIPSFMPLLMFALVFGLSMDYEIFILSRVREAYLRDDAADNRRSIIDGVAASAQVIAPAAMIMILVFAGFAMDSDGNIRIMGFGLAVAVLIDATLMRLILIPASMSLMGRANWWPRTGCVYRRQQVGK